MLGAISSGRSVIFARMQFNFPGTGLHADQRREHIFNLQVGMIRSILIRFGFLLRSTA